MKNPTEPEPPAVVVMRIPRAEKSAWVRAARPGPLVEWIRKTLNEKAAGSPPDRKTSDRKTK